MALVGWTPDFPHASSFLDVSFHSRSITDESSTNRSFCRFPELDAILDRARASTSPRERRRLYRAASMVIAREAPWAFAWNSTRLEIAQPWVRGYRPHPIHEASYVDVWIDPSRGLPERRLHGEAP